MATDGSVILSRVELSVPDQDTSGMTDAYGEGAPVYDLRSHNINLWSFTDSDEGPDVVVLREVDGNPLQLNDGNSTIRAIQKVYSTDPDDMIWPQP